MTDIIILTAIAAIVGAASLYIYRAKKNGAKCIGCPAGGCGSCSSACGCGCGDRQ